MLPMTSEIRTVKQVAGSNPTQNDTCNIDTVREVMYAAIPNAAAWNMESWPVKPKIKLKLTAAIASMKLKMKMVRMKLLWTRAGKIKKGTQSNTFIVPSRTGLRAGRAGSPRRIPDR